MPAQRRDARGRFASGSSGFRGIFDFMKPGPQFQPPQFHGAPNQIDDTHIRPASHTGVTPASSRGFSSGGGRPAHVDLAFSTHYEDEAWGYAIATGRRRKDHPENSDPDPRHRSRVYQVAPAPDQYQEHKGGEIESEQGFRIIGEHLHKAGETGTFPQVNWNAYKARSASSPEHVATDQDRNHSYMDVHAPTHRLDHESLEAARQKPNKGKLREADSYQRGAVDERHDDQLNLFTGKTVAEHRQYENTPGVTMHLDRGKQWDEVAFARDPTAKTIRASKPYHRVDEQFGTVR